ncbi:MAG: hypothetical protein K6E30_01010 [Lachnospiraceae bacterium]|nr:hypothetical protein [Lachnospiraceae bacterium]
MEEKKKGNRLLNFIIKLRYRISLDKKTFIIYSILRGLVILTLVRMLLARSYEGAMICVLSLILFLLPAAFEEYFKIKIPPLFEGIIYVFIYAAEILGEINNYYILIPGWDTLLHTINGFLCAAAGFSLIYLLNRNSRNFNLSPVYLTLVAFCFSMTVGVMWEFIEFFADYFLLLDMQKDFVIPRFSSVTLDPSGSGSPVVVRNITHTVIRTISGATYTIEGGYLDIGLIDTMKDLQVNFLGAVAFSLIGYSTLKSKKYSAIADNLMMRPVSPEQQKQEEAEIRWREWRDREKGRRKRRKGRGKGAAVPQGSGLQDEAGERA